MVKKDNAAKFPYPTARITRQLRSKVDDKMISSKVKMATNQFLGDLTDIVAADMDAFSGKTVKMDAFVRASRPYTYADRLEEEEREVVEQLENVRIRMDKLIRDFRSTFDIIDENDFKVGHEELHGSEAEDGAEKPKTIADMTIEEMDI